MNFTKKVVNDILVVTLNQDRTTYKDYEELKQGIQPELDNGTKKLIIDMHLCSFVDSTVLGLFINFLKQLEGNLKLVDVHGDVQVILDITRTSTLFHCYATIDEAISSF